MVQFNFTYDPSISLEQRVGFELAAMIWSTYLTDDVTINLHIAGSNNLGENGQAVGGAVPILHEQNYAIYQEYAAADATSEHDESALNSLQEGNTVDFLINNQVVDGNTDILLTSAQAKALGMDEAIVLNNGNGNSHGNANGPSSTWDRDLVDPNALDGYIIVNNSFDWNYDYTRSGEAPEGTLDFMSMALHEIGHQLGFISSLDGPLELNTLHSGETEAEGFTVLDLFRHSVDSTGVENPDGSVTDLTLGQNSYFSIDGGQTNLGDFADGIDYQASHWNRMQVALGVMDPTLAYQERLRLNYVDLQALDVLGWDVDYGALNAGLDIESLLTLAENKVENSLGLSETALDTHRGGGQHGDRYQLSYNQWWSVFEQHVLDLGYSQWWQIFELGYSQWGQFEEGLGDVGYSQWWQQFEQSVIDLGYSQWWQQFESDLSEIGYSQWWQLLEIGYSQWWQKLEKYFSKLDTVDGHASSETSEAANGGVAGEDARVYHTGEHDDIIAGDSKQDRINAGRGDDLIDGKAGHDVIWGEAGEDIIYGHDGDDLIYGGDDDDLILGETHDDELHGEAGHDIVSGGSGDDIVTGGHGKDDLKGGWGRDVIDGGEGNDLLDGEASSDLLIGGEGRDQIHGGSGDDVIYGDAYEGDESLQELRRQLQARAETSDGAETPTAETNSSGPIRVEAESMTLSGDYYIKTDWNNDSGDSVATTGTSTATTTFSGPSGNYMVIARYFDEMGGDGQLDFSLNGTNLNSFTLNQNTDHYFTRTVAQNLTLSTGDQFTVTAIGNGADEAGFDYLEFVPLDNLIISSTPTTVFVNELGDDDDDDASASFTPPSSTGEGFRVEAESMTLLGDYFTESNASASGNGLIAVRNQGEGKALTAFSGEAGYYNITVGYYDENDTGIGQLAAALNGTELDSWALDQSLGSSVANAQTFTTRAVASTVFLRDGDIFELTGLRGESSSGSDELARVDYVDFIKVDFTQESSDDDGNSDDTANEIIPSEPVVIGAAIRTEAESMDVMGYFVESNSNASGGQLLRTNSSGIAKSQFSGASGYYNIIVAYYEENDGVSTISASLGDTELDSWQLTQDLGSHIVSGQNRAVRTVATQVQIDTGDELRLEGIRVDGEHARLDYVEFVPVSAPIDPTTITPEDDSLEGGRGNDTLYGGEGHDILYGDSQNDNSSHFFQGSQTYNGHTYLLSDVGTWEQAQIQAQQLGGNLVTLNDAAEETWIRNTFSNTERLWTGFSDVVTEGEWQWVSGEAVTYTNWAPNEPNNDGGGQDFGSINYKNRWDDVYLTGLGGSGFQGIIEINETDNDILVGGEGNDTLYGNGGDDELYGDEQYSSNNNSTLSNGLVGHWSFDETTGTQVGDSTGNNPGTLINAVQNPVRRAGQVGGALNFDGDNDRVEVSDSASLDITNTLTLATWVRADTFSNWGGLINKGQSNITYGLDFTSDGRLAFQANYGSVTGGNGSYFQWSNASLTTQQWHHVAVSYDGNNIHFYIDGQLDSTHQASIIFGTNNEVLTLGADLTGSHLDGELDDARVYDRALSAEEITQLATGEPVVSVNSEGGNDKLYGGTGNDTLEGGAGNDVLEGTDAIAAGYFEKDLLGGGLGADTFVLGNANQVYYLGGGERDYATISDFNAFEDIVQLSGAASDYTLQQQGSDTYLYHQASGSDLVAIFKNNSNVSFGNGFTFK